MKNANLNETKSRRRSSRGSTNAEEDAIPSSKVAKIDDLKNMSDEIKCDLKNKNVKNEGEKKVENLDRRIISLEESEAETRDSSQDVAEFQNTCSNIEERLSKIHQLKLDSDNDNADIIAEQRVEATLLTTNLKKLNRLAQIRGRSSKEGTQTVKKRVDNLHLDLQNLLYELMHVKKEIQKCMNFSSKDEDLDLLDVDNFYKDAPKEISQPKLTKENPHQQMLARLDFELMKRKELTSAKDELVTKKKQTEQEINQKSEYLSNLKPRLEQILKASRPVQEYMNIPLEAEAMIQETAQYLSRPLYVLYIQAKAFKDVCDSNLEIDIEGDQLEAKNLFYADDIDDGSDVFNEMLSMSDLSDTETEAEPEQEKRGTRNKHKQVKQQVKKQQSRLLQAHPLKICLTVNEKDAFKIKITFHHYVALKITAVKIEVKMADKYEAISQSPLVSAVSILQDLCCFDTGKISPNSANTYQLDQFKMEPFENHISTIGRPYFWVQWVCGLNYLPNQGNVCSTPDASTSVKHFQKVVLAIKERMRSRIALQEQVLSLQRLQVPEPIKEEMKSSFPSKVISVLSNWSEATYEDAQTLDDYKTFEEFGMINEDCLFYKTTLTRDDNQSVEVFVTVHADYPRQAPLLLLSFKDGKNKVNQDVDLKALENEVNSYCEELREKGSSDHLLSNMLHKLQFCFDMFCETGSSSDGKERLYARKRRGRDRRRPYCYSKDGGYFLQR